MHLTIHKTDQPHLDQLHVASAKLGWTGRAVALCLRMALTPPVRLTRTRHECNSGTRLLASLWLAVFVHTVSSHNCNSHKFNLRVSNPISKYIHRITCVLNQSKQIIVLRTCMHAIIQNARVSKKLQDSFVRMQLRTVWIYNVPSAIT